MNESSQQNCLTAGCSSQNQNTSREKQEEGSGNLPSELVDSVSKDAVVQNLQAIENLTPELNTSKYELEMSSKQVSGVPMCIEIVGSKAEDKCHINGISVSKENELGGIPEFNSKILLGEPSDTKTAQSTALNCQAIDSFQNELCSEHVQSGSMDTEKMASDSVDGGLSGIETMILASAAQSCPTTKCTTLEHATSNERHEISSTHVSSDPMDILIVEVDAEEIGQTTGDSALEDKILTQNPDMDSELVLDEPMEVTTAGSYARNFQTVDSCSNELSSEHVQGNGVETSIGGSDCVNVVPSGMETNITGSISLKCHKNGSPILDQTSSDKNDEGSVKHNLSEGLDIRMIGSDAENYHLTGNLVLNESIIGEKCDLDSERVLDEAIETRIAASNPQNFQPMELCFEHVKGEAKENKVAGSDSVDVGQSSFAPMSTTENYNGLAPEGSTISSRSKKRKSTSGPSPSTVRVLRPRLNGLCKTPDTAGGSANVSVEKEKKRKRRKRRTKEALDNEFSKLRKRLRYFLSRMGYEHTFIDAYSGEGWKGQSSEKLKPDKELQRASSQILKFKRRIRELFQHLDSSCAEGKFQESLFDSEGQISSEDIFCAKCGSKETSADNDIILCDGICDRGFHQMCLEPPLLKEEIPPDDEGWLCPGCDCKVDCIDVLNDSQGTNLSINDTWEKVFPEAAAMAAGDILDDISGLPSDDSEDYEYNPDGSDGEQVEEAVNTEASSSEDDSDFTSASDDAVVRPADDPYLGLPSDDSEDDNYDPNALDLEENKEESSSSDFSSASEYYSASSDGDEPSGTENDKVPSSVDGHMLPGSSKRRSKMTGTKDLSVNSELLSILEPDSQREPSPVSGKRQRERLDYRMLHDEAYGNVPSDSSDDEDWVEADDIPKGKGVGVRKESSLSPETDSQANIRGGGAKDAQIIDSKDAGSTKKRRGRSKKESFMCPKTDSQANMCGESTKDAQMRNLKETENTQKRRGRPKKDSVGANKAAAVACGHSPSQILVDKIGIASSSEFLGEAETQEAPRNVPSDPSDDKDWTEADDASKGKGYAVREGSSLSPKSDSQVNMSKRSTKDPQMGDSEEAADSKKRRGRPKKNFDDAKNSTAETDMGSSEPAFIDKIATASVKGNDASKGKGDAVRERSSLSPKSDSQVNTSKRSTKDPQMGDLKETTNSKKRRGRPKKNSNGANDSTAETHVDNPEPAFIDKIATASASKALGEAVTQRLYESFKENKYPTRAAKESLADELGISFQQVDKWFGNARWSLRKFAEPETRDCNKVEDRGLSEVMTPKASKNVGGDVSVAPDNQRLNEDSSNDRTLVISIPAKTANTEQVPRSRKKGQTPNQVVSPSRILTRSRQAATK